ncbi:hypothetical protein Tco_1029988 [Tanacetum coccineum]|uniref:Integrase, catalytic region, zinc finger, CCHC-type, peptidase aspartic, catalytic n=1 Tax=Tanacetum coccineum TaxID=301880 RepID=A0ABQ5G783_9ASTR
MELHDVSYGIEYVARPLLLFFSSENQLLWFRYREYDLAHLNSFLSFLFIMSGSQFNTAYPMGWIRRIGDFLKSGPRTDTLYLLDGYGVLVFKIKIYKPTNNNLKTSSNISRANQDNTSRIKRGTGYDNQKADNVVGAKENELEARYLYMEKIQEVTPDAAENYGPIFDVEPLQKDDDDDLARERDLLASLIEKLKCEIDESKDRNKLLESSNKTLIEKLKILKKFQAELDRYHDVNYASKVEIECAKAKGELISYRMSSENFVKPEFLKKAQRANPRLYDIGCNNDNLALMLAPKSDETIHLAQECRSKLSKPATFLDSLAKKKFSKSKSVIINNVSNDLSKPVTAQILPQNENQVQKNTNVIAPGMYKVHTMPNQTRTKQLPQDIRKTNKHVSFSTGVILTTSVSRPQLNSNRLEDRVMHNNSQGKKQQVEDYRRNFKFSNNKTSVTACNDSLNAKTSNVNFVCVTCGKCVLNDNHDMCVLHYINGVNSRTRQPIDVPISTREPKRHVNQFVATPLKKIAAIESTNQKPKSITRKQYEHVSTMKFGNDQIAPILGYGDLVQGNVTIKRFYYVERLNHNLFSVGQFYDADLEIAFRKSTCYIRDLKGNDILTGSRGIDLYSITLQDTSTPNPICSTAKASSS